MEELKQLKERLEQERLEQERLKQEQAVQKGKEMRSLRIAAGIVILLTMILIILLIKISRRKKVHSRRP